MDVRLGGGALVVRARQLLGRAVRALVDQGMQQLDVDRRVPTATARRGQHRPAVAGALDPAHQGIDVDRKPSGDLGVRLDAAFVRAHRPLAKRGRIGIRHARNRSQVDHQLK
jgi:hypothetical protein